MQLQGLEETKSSKTFNVSRLRLKRRVNGKNPDVVENIKVLGFHFLYRARTRIGATLLKTYEEVYEGCDEVGFSVG